MKKLNELSPPSGVTYRLVHIWNWSSTSVVSVKEKAQQQPSLWCFSWYYFTSLSSPLFDVHTAVDHSNLFIIRDKERWWICWNRRQRTSHTDSHRGQPHLRRPNHARVTGSAHREIWGGAGLLRHGSGVKVFLHQAGRSFLLCCVSLNKCGSR